MKKQPDVTAKTKKALQDAFWAIYRTKKIEQITVKEITEKAGYNRGTFYVYFIDIYDVLKQLEDSLLFDIKHAPYIDIIQIESPVIINQFMAMYEKNAEYFCVLLSENGNPHFAEKLKTIYKSRLYKGLNITPDDTMVEYLFEYMLSSMIAVLTRWFQNDRNIPLKDLLVLLYSIMTEGVVKELKKNIIR